MNSCNQQPNCYQNYQHCSQNLIYQPQIGQQSSTLNSQQVVAQGNTVNSKPTVQQCSTLNCEQPSSIIEEKVKNGMFLIPKNANFDNRGIYLIQDDVNKSSNAKKCLETEEVKIKSKIPEERIKKCKYKFLEPPRQTGRLLINKEDDVYDPQPQPLIEIYKRQDLNKPTTKTFRQKPPCQPKPVDEIITIPGKRITPCQRIVKIIQKPFEHVQDVYTELWKPYKYDVEVKLNENKNKPPPPNLKNTTYIIEPLYKDSISRIEYQSQTVDPKDYAKEYQSELKDDSELPECVKDLTFNKSPMYGFTGNVAALELLKDIDWESKIKNPVLKEMLRFHFNKE